MSIISAAMNLMSVLSNVGKAVQTAQSIYQLITGNQSGQQGNQSIISAINEFDASVTQELTQIENTLQAIENLIEDQSLQSSWAPFGSALANLQSASKNFSVILGTLTQTSDTKNYPSGYMVINLDMSQDFVQWCDSTIIVNGESLPQPMALASYVQNLSNTISNIPTTSINSNSLSDIWQQFYQYGSNNQQPQFQNITALDWQIKLIEMIYQSLCRSFIVHETCISLYILAGGSATYNTMAYTLNDYFGTADQSESIWNSLSSAADSIVNQNNSSIFNDFNKVSTAGNSEFAIETQSFQSFFSTEASYFWYRPADQYGSSNEGYYKVPASSATIVAASPAQLLAGPGEFLTNFRFFLTTENSINYYSVSQTYAWSGSQLPVEITTAEQFQELTGETGSLEQIMCLKATPIKVGSNISFEPQPDIDNSDYGNTPVSVIAMTIANGGYIYSGMNWGWQSSPSDAPPDMDANNGSWVITGVQFASNLSNNYQRANLPLSMCGLLLQWSWLDVSNPAAPTISNPTEFTPLSTATPAAPSGVAEQGVILSPEVFPLLPSFDPRSVGNSSNFPSDNLSLGFITTAAPASGQQLTPPLKPNTLTPALAGTDYAIGMTARSAWPIYRMNPLSPGYLAQLGWNVNNKSFSGPPPNS